STPRAGAAAAARDLRGLRGARGAGAFFTGLGIAACLQRLHVAGSSPCMHSSSSAAIPLSVRPSSPWEVEVRGERGEITRSPLDPEAASTAGKMTFEHESAHGGAWQTQRTRNVVRVHPLVFRSRLHPTKVPRPEHPRHGPTGPVVSATELAGRGPSRRWR